MNCVGGKKHFSTSFKPKSNLRLRFCSNFGSLQKHCSDFGCPQSGGQGTSCQDVKHIIFRTTAMKDQNEEGLLISVNIFWSLTSIIFLTEGQIVI